MCFHCSVLTRRDKVLYQTRFCVYRKSIFPNSIHCISRTHASSSFSVFEMMINCTETIKSLNISDSVEKVLINFEREAHPHCWIIFVRDDKRTLDLGLDPMHPLVTKHFATRSTGCLRSLKTIMEKKSEGRPIFLTRKLFTEYYTYNVPKSIMDFETILDLQSKYSNLDYYIMIDTQKKIHFRLPIVKNLT